MRKERKDIALGAIQLNTGQVDWLPANPRTWTQSDIDDTRDSILEDPDFLEDRPLLVVPFGKAFVAFAGNLRHEGATAAKLSKVPCVVYHPETDADYETILRRAMKDNGQFGKTNWDAIYSSKWGTLPLEKWGLTPKGWTEPEGGEGNMPGAEGGEGGEMPQAHEDDFNEDEDAIKVRCKPGDIWQLGEHRLMCGDSTDLETVKKLMGGALADMVFTDPPYGTTQLEWDKEPDLPAMFNCLENSCKKEAPILITGTQPFVTDLINARRKMFKYEIIWVKTQATGFFNAKKCPLRIHENILVFYNKLPTYNPQKTQKENASLHHVRKNSDYRKVTGGFMGKVGLGKAETWKYEDDGSRYPTDVVYFSNWNGALFGNTEKAVVHPTQKPVDLVTYLISTYSNEGDLVLDAFGGSGTTIIAAEQLNRKCYMMELDPHYCDIILARWEKLTGRKAEKVKQ